MTEEHLQIDFLTEEEKNRFIRFINDLRSCIEIKDLSELLTDTLPEFSIFDYFVLFSYISDANSMIAQGPARRAHLAHAGQDLIGVINERLELEGSDLKEIKKALTDKKVLELGDVEVAELLQKVSNSGKKEVNALARHMNMNMALLQPITVMEGHPGRETVVGLLLVTTSKDRIDHEDRLKLALVSKHLGWLIKNDLDIRRMSREVTSKENSSRLLEAFNKATLGVQVSFDEESIYRVISESLMQSGVGLMAIRKDQKSGDLTFRHMTTSVSMQTAIKQAVSLDMSAIKVKAKATPKIDGTFGLSKPIFIDDIREIIQEIMKAMGMARIIKKFQDLLPKERCIICPVLVKGRCDMVLVVSKDDLEPKDMLSVEVFALHISNAMERILIHRENEEKSRIIRLIHDISTALNKALSMDRIHEVLHIEVSKIFNFDYIGLMMFEHDMHSARNVTILDKGSKVIPSQTTVLFDDDELEELTDLKELRFGKGELSKDASPEAKAFMKPKLRTWIMLPLWMENRFLGILALGCYDEVAFDEHLLNMVSSVKDPLSNAVFNAGILAEERKRSEQLKIVSEVSKLSTTVVSERTLYRDVLRLLSSTFGYKSIHLIKYDPQRHLFCHVQSSDPEEDKLFKGRTSSADKGIIGRALREKRTIVVPNTIEDPDYVTFLDGMQSELVVPIFYNGEVEMFINMESKGLNAYDEQAAVTFETVANEMSSLLSTLRQKELESQRLEHLSAINELGRELLHLGERDRILTAAATIMEQKLSYRRIRVFLMDPRTKGLVLKAVAGLGPSTKKEKTKPKIGEQVPLGAGPIGLAASKGATTLSDAVKPMAEAKILKHGERAEGALLCGPIKVQDEVIGVLGIEAPEDRSLDEWDQLALESMAREVGKALEMAKSMEETRSRSRLLSLVNDISMHMSKDLSKKGVMERFTEDFQKSRNYLDVAIFLVDRAQKLIIKQAQSGDYKGRSPPDYSQSIDEGLFGVCLQKRETMVVNDVTADKRFKSRPWVKTRSEMICPIKLGEEVLGLINVESDKVGAFDDWDRLAVETLSRSLAMTLQNSMLYEEEQRRSDLLRVLSELSTKALKAQDLDMLLQEVVETLEKRFPFHSVCIFMEDERKWPLNVLKIRATAGAYKDLATSGTELPASEGLIGACFRSGKIIICNDTSTDKRFIPEPKSGSLSELCVPIVVNAKTVGVLNVESLRKGAFTQWESITLETVSDLVSRAFQNLSLVEELTRRSRDISGVMEVEKGLAPELDMDSILRKAVGLVHKELSYPNVEIYIVEEQGYEFELKASAHDGDQKKGPRPGLKHSLEAGIIGQTFKQRSLVMVNETMKYDKYFDSLGKAVKSAVVAPIMVGKDLLGVLNIESDEPNEFGDWDRLVITVMCDLLSGALDRSRRYKEQQERETLFSIAYETGNELARATSIDDLLRKASELVRDKFRFFHVDIFVSTMDESGKPVQVLKATSGGLKKKVALGSFAPVGHYLLEWCVLHKEDALVNDVALDPRCKDEAGSDIKSQMVVLVHQGQTIYGAIDVKSKHFDAFTEKDHKALDTVVKQLEGLLMHLEPKKTQE
jgi:putative methionine-R-sulfoxide reductase with GAF domain